MRVHEQQAHMIQIQAGGHPRIILQFPPCLLHFPGMIDIVYRNHPFLIHPRQQIVHITLRGLIRMVCIHIRQIESFTRVYL